MNRTLAACPLALLLLAGCNTNAVDPASLEVGATIPLTSSAFEAGQPLPKKFARFSANLSPPLAWSNAPPGVKTYALICDDPDAHGGAFAHWLVWNIPAEVHELSEGLAAVAVLPDGTHQGQNSFPSVGYAGPDPPAGLHHYTFRLYALDATLELPEYSTTRPELEKAMRGHVLGHGELMGTFKREVESRE